MNKEEFLKEIKKLNIKLTDTMLQQLEEYADFLLTYNEHTNLTAIKTKEEVYLKHFYDSLTLVKIANLQNGKLLDVGTGAGFPGLVLAIVFPNLEVTLLDSNNKKITLVAHLLAGAPLLVTTSNGAVCLDAPLVCLERKKIYY